jgi:hypothetical protein
MDLIPIGDRSLIIVGQQGYRLASSLYGINIMDDGIDIMDDKCFLCDSELGESNAGN